MDDMDQIVPSEAFWRRSMKKVEDAVGRYETLYIMRLTEENRLDHCFADMGWEQDDFNGGMPDPSSDHMNLGATEVMHPFAIASEAIHNLLDDLLGGICRESTDVKVLRQAITVQTKCGEIRRLVLAACEAYYDEQFGKGVVVGKQAHCVWNDIFRLVQLLISNMPRGENRILLEACVHDIRTLLIEVISVSNSNLGWQIHGPGDFASE